MRKAGEGGVGASGRVNGDNHVGNHHGHTNGLVKADGSLAEDVDVWGPPQITTTIATKRWSIAATGTAAATVISLGALTFLSVTTPVESAFTPCVLLAAVFGGCMGSINNRALLANLREQVHFHRGEVERMAIVKKEREERVLERRGSSLPPARKSVPLKSTRRERK